MSPVILHREADLEFLLLGAFDGSRQVRAEAPVGFPARRCRILPLSLPVQIKRRIQPAAVGASVELLASPSPGTTAGPRVPPPCAQAASAASAQNDAGAWPSGGSRVGLTWMVGLTHLLSSPQLLGRGSKCERGQSCVASQCVWSRPQRSVFLPIICPRGPALSCRMGGAARLVLCALSSKVAWVCLFSDSITWVCFT